MKRLLSVSGFLALLHFVWHLIIAGVGALHGSWIGWIFAVASLGLYLVVHVRYKSLKSHHEKEHHDCNYDSY